MGKKKKKIRKQSSGLCSQIFEIWLKRQNFCSGNNCRAMQDNK